MSAEDLEQYESELELQLYREYKDVVGIFTYAVETERRFYLCNAVDLKVRTEGGDVYYEVSMGDAWVWDMYRPARFVKSAKVLTFRDVSIEEIAHSDLEVPKPGQFPQLRKDAFRGFCEAARFGFASAAFLGGGRCRRRSPNSSWVYAVRIWPVQSCSGRACSAGADIGVGRHAPCWKPEGEPTDDTPPRIAEMIKAGAFDRKSEK